MLDLELMHKRYRSFIYLLIAVYMIGWGFTKYQTVFLGLAFGTILSLINLTLMIRKTKRFGDAVANGQTVRSLGSFSRMATAIIAVWAALEYPDRLHLVSVVLGLMTSYIVIMIDIIVQAIRYKGEER